MHDELVILSKKVKEISDPAMITAEAMQAKMRDVEATRVEVAQLLAGDSVAETSLPIGQMLQAIRPVKTSADLINQLRDFLSNVKAKAKGGELSGNLGGAVVECSRG